MIKENDIVLCTVKKIDGTTVFLDIENEQLLGSMILPEVAAGRIRNLGDYVYSGKKIICKVLKIYKDHIELSLRRVTGKERDEVLDRSKKERAFRKILGSYVKDSDEIISKIKEESDLVDYIEEAREKPALFEKYLSKEETKKILQMMSKTEKQKTVKRRFMLRSFSDSGARELKEILNSEGEIYYQGSSIFSVSASGRDFKEAENKINLILHDIEKRAKDKKAIFELVKEK